MAIKQAVIDRIEKSAKVLLTAFPELTFVRVVRDAKNATRFGINDSDRNFRNLAEYNTHEHKPVALTAKHLTALHKFAKQIPKRHTVTFVETAGVAFISEK